MWSGRNTVRQSVRDQLGQVGRHFIVLCLLGKALLTNLDQVDPALFLTVLRALLTITDSSTRAVIL